MSRKLHCIGVENALAVSSTAVSLTVPKGAAHALIAINTNSMRWLAQGDATAPTASVGFLVAAGTILDFTDADWDYTDLLTNFRIIRTSADGTVDALYFD